jgi:protein-tyrosine-phosphatase
MVATFPPGWPSPGRSGRIEPVCTEITIVLNESVRTVLLVNVLAVCTANICRSAAIEGAIRAYATARSLDIEVFSAGTRAHEGQPADSDTTAAARKRGLDLTSHLSQRLTPDLIDMADLVVCAELEHLVQVVGMRPDALPKSFLLLELVDIAAVRRHDDEMASWLERIGRFRTAESVLGSASRYKLSDPYKRGKRKQLQTIEIVSNAADRLVAALVA